MLRQIAGAVALLGLTLSASVVNQALADGKHSRFAEGTHYQVLDEAVSVADPDKIEVREFFFYGCPACYNVEPIVNDWKAQAPDDVDFVRSPVLFIRGAEPLARAYFVAEAKGILDEIHQPIFDAIHKHREPLFSVPALANFFRKYGVDPDEFNDLYSSFGVSTKVRQADTASRDYRLTGVPSFTVNGKYVVLRNNLRNDRETFEVIDYLVNLERED